MLSDRSIHSYCDVDAPIFDHDLFEYLKFATFYDIRHDSLNTQPYSAYKDVVSQARKMAYRPRTPEEREAFVPMIFPFTAELIRSVAVYGKGAPIRFRNVEVETVGPEIGSFPIISRGLTSYGYDVSLADDFKVFSNINSAVIDPKRLDSSCLVSVEAKVDPDTGERYVLMPPNSYLLGRTVEYFVIPRDVMVICVGKSTYARSGAIVNVTPIEAGFEGNVVIEISNSTNLPARVYAGEGISQFVFFKGDQPCAVSYGDRRGKYQGQTGLTLPKV